jgi:spore germination protein KB
VGKPLGVLLGLIYALWFLLLASIVVQEFTLFLNTAILPATPVTVIVVAFMAVVFYALRSGVEVWVRVNEILLWAIIASFAAVVLLPFNSMDLGKLLPIGEHTIGSLIAGSLIGGSWRGEVVIVGMLLPALATTKNTTRNLLLAVLLVGLIAAAVKISVVAVFGGVVTGQYEFPVFSLARMISIGRIIDRLEVLVVIIWVFGTFIKVCALMYCSARAFSESLGFKEYQFLTFPLSILAVALSINMYSNVAELTDFLTYSFVGIGILTFELTIPAILLLIAVLRKRRQPTT